MGPRRTQVHENDAADGTGRKIVPEWDAPSSPGLSAGSRLRPPDFWGIGGLPWVRIHINREDNPNGVMADEICF